MSFNRFIWLFFRVVRKLLKMLTGAGAPISIRNVMVTGKLNRYELHDLIMKARWYAPDKVQIYAFSDDTAELPSNVFLNRKAVYDYFLISKASHIFGNMHHLHRASVIDPAFYSTEECTAWSYLYDRASGDRTYVRQISANNFTRMRQKLKNKKQACCFLTGQSFDKYTEHPETKSMIKVICNSVVKNDAFMEYNNPDVLVFADPVYHFSWNMYAENFRRDVLKTAAKYGTFIMIPENMMALMLKHYPQLSDKLIGIDRASGFCFPSENSLRTYVTDNILTYLMLPVASSLADEIYILGANGRSPDDKMFWKHNSSVQYDSLMQSVADAHPSFFRDRNFVEYQEHHDKVMEGVFRYGESKGKKYISLNRSYLKSINRRYKEEENDIKTETQK